MELRRERLESVFLDPRRAFGPVRLPLEIRWDPLTGESCRVLPAGSLPQPEQQDLDELAAQTRATCPFCPERIETVTPRFVSGVCSEGRFRRGDALLFPNLVPYAKWSSVSVYSPQLHLLQIDALTPSLIADNLLTQIAFARAVLRHDPSSRWVSVNANQLPPSGSSIFHPHLQGAVSPVPTSVQRELADVPPRLLREYVDEERRSGERHVATRAGVDWLTSFAPSGVGEVRAIVLDAGSPADLQPELVDELARGVVDVLRVYARLGFESFNLALTGPPLLLRVVARAYFGAAARSDVMWLERLHGDVATDLWPEALAALLR